MSFIKGSCRVKKNFEGPSHMRNWRGREIAGDKGASERLATTAAGADLWQIGKALRQVRRSPRHRRPGPPRGARARFGRSEYIRKMMDFADHPNALSAGTRIRGSRTDGSIQANFDLLKERSR